jgi:AcrR family transcriptional regulator
VARRDAQRNRQKLVDAGRELFAERGADASLEEVARRAGVGIGTLYRHFPTREALVEVILEEHIGRILIAAEQAADAEDAWEGMVGFLDQVLDLQRKNLPLRHVFHRHAVGESPIAQEQRAQIAAALERLVERAREQGAVRPDFALSDLLFAMWSFIPLFEATGEVAPNAWRRYLQIVVDGMRPAGATPQRVRPLSARQLAAAFEALRGRYQRRRVA